MPILIDKVRISNYRSIKKCSTDLSSLTLLVGANNSGKTSFLRALNLALGVGAKRVSRDDIYIGKNKERSDDKEILIDIRIIPADNEGQRVNEFDDEWREQQFGDLISIDDQDKEFFAFQTKSKYDLLKGEYIIERFKIKEWKDDLDWENQNYKDELKINLSGIPLFFIDAQRDIIQDLRDRTSYFGRLVNKIDVGKELTNDIEGKIKQINENIVGKSEELKYLKTELTKLKQTINSSVEIEINPVNNKMRDISRGLNINLKDTSSESFSLEYHGMGTRSWASLLTYRAFISWQHRQLKSNNQPYHTILALEEPEAHLHPHAQRTLYMQLMEMQGQKIISTHSPFVSSQCQLSEIRHFKKNGSYTEIRSLDLKNINVEDKRKLKRSVLNTRGELLFARAVVLFEGETEEQALPIFAQKHFGKHPYEMGISFIGVGGQNYTPFLKFVESFGVTGFIFSDGEPQTIKVVKSQIENVFGDKAKDILENNLINIANGDNFEKYLANNGFLNAIKNAIKNIEGREYIANYIKQHHGKSKGRSKTDKTCDKCKQSIYEEQQYILNGSDGEKKAILEILIENKTKYAQKIAKEICKGDLPELIKELFIKINTVLQDGTKS